MLVTAQVTARADDPAGLEGGVELGIRDEAIRPQDLRALLGHGRVTSVARARGRRLAAPHFDELARNARPHAPRMQRGLPVAELHRVAGAAGLRLERALDGREACGRCTLRRNAAAPVTLDELALGRSR